GAADHHVRQHQLAYHDDRREGRADGAGRSKRLIAAKRAVTAAAGGETMATQRVGVAMDLVSRVKNILLDPQNEWRVIDGEQDPPNAILKSYVAIVAAIPPICGFIGASIIGVGPYRAGIVLGLISAIIQYVLALIGVYLIAFIIDA